MPVTSLWTVSTVSNLNSLKARILKDAKEARKVREAAVLTGNRAITQLKKTTKTWNHRVEFRLSVQSRIGSDEVSLLISTDDAVWHFLDGGTAWKPVTVTPDWSPKTVPLEFDSYPGSGQVFFTAGSLSLRDRRRDWEYTAGISPRQWSTAPFFLAYLNRNLYLDVQRKLGELVNDLNSGR